MKDTTYPFSSIFANLEVERSWEIVENKRKDEKGAKGALFKEIRGHNLRRCKGIRRDGRRHNLRRDKVIRRDGRRHSLRRGK